MLAVRTLVASFLTAICLLFSHFGLFRAWYGSGARRAFTSSKNIHHRDLDLAVRIAEQKLAHTETPESIPTAPAGGRLALLFLLRTKVDHLDVWRAWLEPEREQQQQRLSIYYHVADSVPSSTREELLSLPGARRVLPTFETGWCELMAAEVALFQAALQDAEAQLFVLLPHDSVPLVPLHVMLATILLPEGGKTPPSAQGRKQSDWSPPTRLCPAGVRGMVTPSSCAHAIEAQWDRSMLFKHHQWLALSRAHALKLVDPQILRSALEIFHTNFMGEPLCSDEVLPLLAIALPNQLLGEPNVSSVRHLPLFRQGAALGFTAFADGLSELGAVAQCITYAPWPGCRGSVAMGRHGKRAKSPVAGGDLASHDRDHLMMDLVEEGVLFARKLGLGGDSTARHLDLISRSTVGMTRLASPRPLQFFPDLVNLHGVAWLNGTLWWIFFWVRWGVTWLDALVPLGLQLVFFSSGAVLAGASAYWLEALPRGMLQKVLAAWLIVHICVFILSIVLFPEYSLLEPLRRVGVLSRSEL